MNYSGIYRITVEYNNKKKFYYGQSQDVYERYDQHLRDLRGGYHPNKHFQRIHNKHPEAKWSFHVLCFAPEEKLDRIEQAFLDKYWGLGDCLNQARYVDNPMRGIKHTEKTKAKMSKARKGKKQSPEHVAKRSKAQKGKKAYHYDHTIRIFRHDDTGEYFIGTQYDFIDKYGLDRSDVSKLIKGWKKSKTTKSGITKVHQVKGWRYLGTCFE